MVSQHGWLLLVSIVGFWSDKRVVVDALFGNSIHIAYCINVLVLSTVDWWQIVLVDRLINDLKLPVWLWSIEIRKLSISLLFKSIHTSDSKLIFKHLLSGSTIISLLIS